MYSFLRDTGLIEHASRNERNLLGRINPTEQDKIDAEWMAESVQGLAWCMGLVELDPFRGCDDNLASHLPKPFSDPSAFIDTARLKPFEEIYQQADLHYRLHWAARSAKLRGEQTAVREDWILERRKSLDWVIGVEGDWDKISLDT